MGFRKFSISVLPSAGQKGQIPLEREWQDARTMQSFLSPTQSGNRLAWSIPSGGTPASVWVPPEVADMVQFLDCQPLASTVKSDASTSLSLFPWL